MAIFRPIRQWPSREYTESSGGPGADASIFGEYGTGAEIQKLKPASLQLPNSQDRCTRHDPTDDVARQGSMKHRLAGREKKSLSGSGAIPSHHCDTAMINRVILPLSALSLAEAAALLSQSVAARV